MRHCPFLMVLGNQIPTALQDKFVNADQIKKPEGTYYFPRIGSFEVYYKGNIVFSKLVTLKWPHPNAIAERINQLDQELKSKAIQQAKPLTTKSKKHRKKSNTRTKSHKRRGVLRPNSRLYSPPIKTKTHTVKSQSKPSSYPSQLANMYQEDYYRFEKNYINKGSDSDSNEDLRFKSYNNMPKEYQKYDIQPIVSDYNQLEVQNESFHHDFSKDEEMQMIDIEEPVVHSHIIEINDTPQYADSFTEDYGDSRGNTHKIEQTHDKYDRLTKDDSYFSSLPESNTNPLQKVQLIKIPTSSEYSNEQDYEGTYEFGSARKASDSNSDSSSEYVENSKKQESSYEHYDQEEYEEDPSKYSESSSESHPIKDSRGSYEQEFSSSNSSTENEEEEEMHPLREVSKSYNVSLPIGIWTNKVTFT